MGQYSGSVKQIIMTTTTIDLLTQLEQFGSIVIMDKQEGDYCIITGYPRNVTTILVEGKTNFTAEYDHDASNWTIDFNIHYKGSKA